MKPLVTHQFNLAMAKLSRSQQREVSEIFSLVGTLAKEELLNSTWLTRIHSKGDGIYTLRGKSVRVFCMFNGDSDIVLLDVTAATGPNVGLSFGEGNETTLFTPQGLPKAYIDRTDEDTIYSFQGRPLAYLDESSNIYGFNGKHLGWFEEGIVWNHQGQRVAFTKSTCPSFTQFEPFKGFKQFKPFKSFKSFAPARPSMGHSVASEGLEGFLEQGR